MARSAEEIRAEMARLQNELNALEEAERAKERAEFGKRIIAKVALFKSLYLDLVRPEDAGGYPDALPSSWLDTKQQQLPREAIIGRRFGLSETEVSNAKESARKLMEKL